MDILVLILGVTVSALCEFLAAALLDLRQSVLSTMADEGSAVGSRFQNAYDATDETALSISIVDMLGIVATVIAVLLLSGGDVATVITEVTILFVALGIAKVIASVIGSRYAEHLLRFTSVLLLTIRTIALPFMILHRILMRLTKREHDEDEAREELEAFVETAREEGALDPGEYRIMTNIMRLSSIDVGDIMTPRTVVFGLNVETTVGEALKTPELQMFSRFPVYDGNDLDSVNGYVITKDVLRAALAGRHNVELGKLKRDISFIPENVTLERALEQFLQQRQQLFMVVDEHGGVEGLLSMEDVLETMLGVEIVDEADHVVDLRQLAKQRRDARIQHLSERRSQTYS